MQKMNSQMGSPLIEPRRLNMPDKQMKHYRLDGDVISRIDQEATSTGRTATRVIEDAVMRRRQFSPRVEELIDAKLRANPKWTHNDVIEWAVLEVLGRSEGAEPVPSRPAPPVSNSTRVSGAAKGGAGVASSMARAKSSREGKSVGSTGRKS